MVNNEKIVVLLDCFTRKEAQAALSAFENAGGEASKIVVAPVTELVAKQSTAEAVAAVAEGRWPGGTPRVGSKHSALIAKATKRDAVAIMRCFKSILSPDADPAFAMVTETGMSWRVEEYLAHIHKEHKYMKTADPSMDPDMKEMNLRKGSMSTPENRPFGDS